jgi:NAD(P)-dependent dehydrogenase (short-subunit alcohol dehydrogenase family)
MAKKTVLITGCSSGFGAATARYFANQGWQVIATMRNPNDGDHLSGRDGVFVTRLDVQDKASIAQAISAGIAHFGRIDVLINNAGFGLFGIFETTPAEQIREQFEVNLFGVMDVTREILPHFRANKTGVILNVSSGGGVFTLPMISLYCASKFALEGFSEALTYELSPLGITLKLVEVGGSISTNFGKRSGKDSGLDQAPSDYGGFIAAVGGVFAELRDAAIADPDDVAKFIYEAGTDGTDRLRYVTGEDIKPLIKARRETSEQDYIRFMRSRFMVNLGEGRRS